MIKLFWQFMFQLINWLREGFALKKKNKTRFTIYLGKFNKRRPFLLTFSLPAYIQL